MEVIYGRISTEGQNSEIQKIEGYKTYIDICSGSVPFKERKQAKKLINQIEGNNVKSIRVKSIDRLGRDLKDILNTIEYFISKGVEVYAERECLFSHNEGVKNPTFNLMVGLLGSVAEFEKQRIKERTSEGIAKAKKEGRFLGRSFGTTESKETILNKSKNAKAVNLIKKGASLNYIKNATNLSKPTIIKLKKLISE
jgi:DNA invertase Pin-like site-specific DNA recombinase